MSTRASGTGTGTGTSSDSVAGLSCVCGRPGRPRLAVKGTVFTVTLTGKLPPRDESVRDERGEGPKSRGPGPGRRVPGNEARLRRALVGA